MSLLLGKKKFTGRHCLVVMVMYVLKVNARLDVGQIVCVYLVFLFVDKNIPINLQGEKKKSLLQIKCFGTIDRMVYYLQKKVNDPKTN